MRGFTAGLLLLSAVTIFTAPPVSAACTLPNGTFDSDVSGWSNFADFDAGRGNPPGSNHVGPVPISNSGNSWSDCMLVAPGDAFTLEAEVLFPTGENANAAAQLGILYYSDATCSSFLSLEVAPGVSNSVQEVWLPTSAGSVVAPAGAQGARISLNVIAGPTQTANANWDNVLLSTQPVESVPVPMLDPSGLVLLAGVLALGGLVALRART